MSETTQEERDEARRFCTIPISFIRDADRLAAIERDIQALEDELRKLGAAKADTLFIASRLRAIILREAG